MRHVTLIEKQCGHYGFVRTEYGQRHINCTQCGLHTHEPDQLSVTITRRKVLQDVEIPHLSNTEVDLWIKKHLER